MKIFTAILLAAPLLASIISQWMNQPSVQKRLENNCDTNGGWEGWAQLELELEFKAAFKLQGTDIREQGKVYGNAKFADFVLPKSPARKGMIIELKCENKTGQKKTGIGKPVKDDKEKNIEVVGAYSDYTFIALAMAFTSESDKELKRIGMRPIPGAQVAVEAPNMMRTYKEVIPLPKLTTDMDDLSKVLNNLYIQKTKPAPKSAPKPAPGKKTSP